MKGYLTRRFEGIPLGFFIRRSICTTWTWRVNRGNGFYGTKLGELIQLKYRYNISDPHADHIPVEHKNDFAAAVAAWQALAAATKKWWDGEAQRLRLQMSGYNLYIRRYRLKEL